MVKEYNTEDAHQAQGVINGALNYGTFNKYLSVNKDRIMKLIREILYA